MTNFASLDTPGDPGIVKVVELSAFEEYISCFVTVAPPWRIFFHFYENVAQYQFYKYGYQKSVFVSINSHNFNFFTEMHSLKA